LAALEGDVQRAVGNIEQQQRMLQSAAVHAACRVPMVVPPAMLSGMGGGSRGTHSTKTNPDPNPNPNPSPNPNPDPDPDPDPDSSQAAHLPQGRAQKLHWSRVGSLSSRRRSRRHSRSICQRAAGAR
jgi:hypothetical protein